MTEPTTSGKRIAKNTMMLYIRMLFSMTVSLYTSRVVLQTLGVENYGINSVVGGVVGLFSFLNASMSGATSRFLNYEMGVGNFTKLRETFSSALIIHILIAIIIVILAESVGLWYMCNRLVIPGGRFNAAMWVYQCAVISSALTITQVPYNALIIARERMDAYAYIDMASIVAKLLIVYILTIGNFDKLKLYAALGVAVTIIFTIVYRGYCFRHFPESHFIMCWNKKILKSLSSFSIYNLYGNFGSVVNLQGTSLVLNRFFGVILNTASGLAMTVSGIISGFSTNIMTAFKPQITMSYARKDLLQFQKLMLLAIKLILVVYVLIAVPAFVEIQSVLKLWLGIVPEYTSLFCRCILVSIFFETFRFIITMGIHAVGNVRVISFWTGTFLLVNPIIVFIIFKTTDIPDYAYYSIIAANFILGILDVMLLKHYVPQIDALRLLGSMFSIFVLAGFVLIGLLLLSAVINPGFLRICLVTFLAVTAISGIFLGFFIEIGQRKYIISFVKSKLHLNG